MRRRNLCPSFELPVAGSPGTPFFPFFPFFSSFFFFFFFFCFGRRKWRNPEQLRRRGEAKPRATAASFSFFSFLSSFFFFFFSILAVENGGIRSCCVVGERQSCCIVGVGSSGKKKTTQPKTTLFWVGVIFFKNQNTPKRRRFEVTVFFKIRTPKTTSF